MDDEIKKHLDELAEFHAKGQSRYLQQVFRKAGQKKPKDYSIVLRIDLVHCPWILCWSHEVERVRTELDEPELRVRRFKCSKCGLHFHVEESVPEKRLIIQENPD